MKNKNAPAWGRFVFYNFLKRRAFFLKLGFPKSIGELFGKRRNRAKGKGFSLAGSLARRSSFDDVAHLSSRRDNLRKIQDPTRVLVFFGCIANVVVSKSLYGLRLGDCDATLAMTVIRHSEERSSVGIPKSEALRTSFVRLRRYARNDRYPSFRGTKFRRNPPKAKLYELRLGRAAVLFL